jgi:hypothetical protein
MSEQTTGNVVKKLVEFASKADQFAAATRETAPAADRHSA